MSNNEDWLLRPVLHNLCKYESIIDGTLTLLDIAILNEALDVRAENMLRADEAAERNRNR